MIIGDMPEREVPILIQNSTPWKLKLDWDLRIGPGLIPCSSKEVRGNVECCRTPWTEGKKCRFIAADFSIVYVFPEQGNKLTC